MLLLVELVIVCAVDKWGRWSKFQQYGLASESLENLMESWFSERIPGWDNLEYFEKGDSENLWLCVLLVEFSDADWGMGEGGEFSETVNGDLEFFKVNDAASS